MIAQVGFRIHPSTIPEPVVSAGAVLKSRQRLRLHVDRDGQPAEDLWVVAINEGLGEGDAGRHDANAGFEGGPGHDLV